MWTLFLCLYIISSVLHNNIFLVFFFQSQQYTNFVCWHMNHSFQWESWYIWAFFTHLYTCRIRKSPKWLVYNDSDDVTSSPFTFMANSAWSKLWLFWVAGGKVEKKMLGWRWDYSTFCTFTLKVQLLQCVKMNKCTNGKLKVWYCP